MHILTHRTNILFDQKMWSQLSSLSQKRQSSVGELIRQAVRNVYFESLEQGKKTQAIDFILEVRPRFVNRLDYKALVDYGRRS